MFCPSPPTQFYDFSLSKQMTKNTHKTHKWNSKQTNKTPIRQKLPAQNKMKQNKEKFILYWPTGPGPGTYLRLSLIYPMICHWRERVFLLPQVSIANSSCLGTGPVPPLSVGTLSDLTLCRSCACCQSLWVHICVSLYAWETEDITSNSYNLSLSISSYVTDPWGEELNGL